jgi:predicted AlkP superfamily phosphohydrolase/phosphomutase
MGIVTLKSNDYFVISSKNPKKITIISLLVTDQLKKITIISLLITYPPKKVLINSLIITVR